MPQHFEVGPTEGDGWFVDVSVSSYRLHKVIVESNNKPSQIDRLDLKGKIVSPNRLWGHRIIVELYKREEPQISVIEGYKGIGKLFFGTDALLSEVESERIARGYFAAAIDVGLEIFDDLANLLVSVEGKTGIARDLQLIVIGLLNHWELKGDLPLQYFRLTLRSRRKNPQKGRHTMVPPVQLIPPLTSHDDV